MKTSWIALVTILAPGCQPSTASQPSLPGVWQIASIRTADALDDDPEPGQAIFTQDHYSLLWIAGDSSMRSFQERFVPNETEMIRRYGEIVVNAGLYFQEDDSTLTLRPTVSRVPEFMGGGQLTYRFRLSADTLWLTSLDEYSFDGVQAPWARAGNRVTLRLLRIESVQ